MSHTSLWYEIKKYCDVIPDYALAFKFAKRKDFFFRIFPLYKEDILQEIAVCCLEATSIKELGNLLSKRIRYFYKHILGNYVRTKKYNTKRFKKYNPIYFNHCDICGIERKEYMYKSLFPGKMVCRRCYRRHKKKYAK